MILKKRIKHLLFIYVALLTLGANTKLVGEVNKIDSLLTRFDKKQTDTNQINILLEISDIANMISYDSAMYFLEQAEQIADELQSENKWTFFSKIARKYAQFGMYYLAIKNTISSIHYHNDSSGNEYHKHLKLKNRLAYYYSIVGNYKQSTHILIQNIEKTKDLPKIQANSYTYLAYTFRRMEEFNKSLVFFKKAIQTMDSVQEIVQYSNVLNEIGNIFSALRLNDSAMLYFYRSLSIRKKINNKQNLLYSYNDIGAHFISTNNNDSAKQYFIKCLEIAKQRDNQWEKAYVYINLGSVYTRQKIFDSAYYYMNLSSQINQVLKNKSLQLTIYVISKEYYKNTDNFPKALEYSELLLNLRDSLQKEQNTRQIYEFESYYQSRLKEQEITLLKKKEQKQRTIRNLLILIVTVLIFFAIIIYRNYKFRARANTLLIQQNEEIKMQQAELINQNDEIAAQRDELLVQTEQIENQRMLLYQQKQQITDSLHYANKIQHALLPDIHTLQASFPQSFVIYKPQQIVGGDFYWLQKVNKKTVLAVADCTGHGVPGGFMSMLGITFLNSIVSTKGILQPNAILKEMKIEISKALKHYHHAETIKDGMDISICCFDFEKQVLHYAAAKHSIYLVFKTKDSPLQTIREIKGNPNTISVDADFMDEFSVQDFDLKEIQTIYLGTDGYSDQFGGERNRKLNKKNFKEILREASQLPIAEQKNYLENTLIRWKQNQAQTDDVLLLGIQI